MNDRSRELVQQALSTTIGTDVGILPPDENLIESGILDSLHSINFINEIHKIVGVQVFEEHEIVIEIFTLATLEEKVREAMGT